MYLANFLHPRAFEPEGPSLQALFREEYMTKRREPKPERTNDISQPADVADLLLTPLLGMQWFAFP